MPSPLLSALRNPANAVTVGRIALLILMALAVQSRHLAVRAACVGSIPVLFLLDSLDGFLARRFGCASKLGSVLDVVGDRIAETVLWFLMTSFGLVPLWVPVVVVVRSYLTDGFRSAALEKGHTAFSMMKSEWGYNLVASPFSRAAYAILKGVAFTIGAAIWAFGWQDWTAVVVVFYASAALAIALCLVRGALSIRESAAWL